MTQDSSTTTTPRTVQTGLYYYDIKFSGAGVEVVSNEKAADAHGPANCSHPSTQEDIGGATAVDW